MIAEYNPFHNGHLYHIEHSAQMTGADYTIVAMSGNFMQRGTPAILNKYLRAEMALKCGADLVLEIPSFYSCASAEFYALGGVSLVDLLGVTDSLCFGSECGSTVPLSHIAKILADEPESYSFLLNEALSSGLSFPAAREKALTAFLSSDPAPVLSSPNNILGIEYCKALILRNSTVSPITFRRVGAAYHETDAKGILSSAKAIRNALLSDAESKAVCASTPKAVSELLFRHTNAFLTSDDFSSLLLYKLLSQAQAGYTGYLDVSQDLSDKIRKNLFRFQSFEQFCQLLKSKDCTYSRISRCLLHILLDIRTKDMDFLRSVGYVPYARVLGLKKSASALLSAIKKNSSIPLITKLADAHRQLDETVLSILQKDIQISHVYNAVLSQKTGEPLQNEYTTPIITL